MNPSTPSPTIHAFGKIPGEGDFIRFGPTTAHSQSFVQDILHASQRAYGALQRNHEFVWHFCKHPQNRSPVAQAPNFAAPAHPRGQRAVGVLCASQDAVGRRLPLCLWLEWQDGSPLGISEQVAHWPHCLAPWRARLEELALRFSRDKSHKGQQLQTELEAFAQKLPPPQAWPWPRGREQWPIDSDELWVELFAGLDRPRAAQWISTLMERTLWAYHGRSSLNICPMGSDISQFFWAELVQPIHASPPTQVFWRSAPPICILGLGAEPPQLLASVFAQSLQEQPLFDLGDPRLRTDAGPERQRHELELRSLLEQENRDISALIRALHADFSSLGASLAQAQPPPRSR